MHDSRWLVGCIHVAWFPDDLEAASSTRDPAGRIFGACAGKPSGCSFAGEQREQGHIFEKFSIDKGFVLPVLVPWLA